MKVATWVEIAQEVEVDVTLGEVLSALEELPESERWPAIASAVNCAYGVLMRVSDAGIEGLNEHQRKIIADGLLEQARRYAGKERLAL